MLHLPWKSSAGFRVVLGLKCNMVLHLHWQVPLLHLHWKILLLAQVFSIRSIADFLEKSPSTISREIHKHSLVKMPNSCDCNDYNGCNVKHVCGSKDCNKKCRSCHLAKKYCEHYDKRSCEHRNGSKVKLCNGCTKIKLKIISESDVNLTPKLLKH